MFESLSGCIAASRKHRPEAGDGAALAFERSRLAAVFVAVMLVPVLLVLEGPRDWRMAVLAAAPTIPPMIALITVRRFGVDLAIACQFALGVFMATIAAASGFGLATPALILALMMIDSLLLGRTIASSLSTAALVAAAGFVVLTAGVGVGGVEAAADVRMLLPWLAIPSLAQLCAAIVLWRDHYRAVDRLQIRPQNHLSDSVERAQREAGLQLDRAGRVLDMTVNSQDVTGIAPHVLEGRGLVERLHLLDRPLLLKAVSDAAMDSHSAVIRLRIAQTDDIGPVRFRWFEGRLFPISGEHESALIMLRDIDSEVSHLEADEARRQQAEVERQRRAGFLADLSHDVRTPLNAILGFSELLSNPLTQPRDSERVTEYADIVHRSGRDLLEVVTMLVEMTRVDNGVFEFSEDSVKPRKLLEQLRETLSEAIERPSLQLFISGEADFDGWQVDQRAARQAFFGVASSLVDLNADADLDVMVEADMTHLNFRFRAVRFDQDRGQGRRSVTAGLSLEVAKRLSGLMGGSVHFNALNAPQDAELRLPLAGREDRRGKAAAAETIILSHYRQPTKSNASTETLRKSA